MKTLLLVSADHMKPIDPGGHRGARPPLTAFEGAGSWNETDRDTNL
jgi:hypothetical protein